MTSHGSAMLKIFKRSDAGVIYGWHKKFGSPEWEASLSDEKYISFLTIVERQESIEKQGKLKDVRTKLADLYVKTGEFVRATEYLGQLLATAKTPEEKKDILRKLLDAYLKQSNVKAASELVENCLLEKDLGPDSFVVQLIDNYLSTPPGGIDPNVMLNAIVGIKVPAEKPLWQKQVELWSKQHPKQKIEAKEPNKPVDSAG